MTGAAPAATASAPAAAAAAADLIRSADRTHTLPDGRQITYIDCGDGGSADVVLFLHPVQGNRFMALTLHADAVALRLRVIAPDRPGYGGSTQAEGRSVTSFMPDLDHLLSDLGVSRLAVLGLSAGSMYALAMTRDPSLAPRVAGRVTLLPPWIPPTSLPPGHAPPRSLALLRLAPRALTGLFVGLTNAWVARKLRGEGVTVADVMTRSKPHEVDAFKSDPANDAYYRAMIQEWSRPGASLGTAEEMLLCADAAGAGRDLGFSYIEDIEAPARVFVGSEDALVSIEAVRSWSDVAGGSARVEVVGIEGGTHDGVMHTHKRAALEALAAGLRGAA